MESREFKRIDETFADYKEYDEASKTYKLVKDNSQQRKL